MSKRSRHNALHKLEGAQKSYRRLKKIPTSNEVTPEDEELINSVFKNSLSLLESNSFDPEVLKYAVLGIAECIRLSDYNSLSPLEVKSIFKALLSLLPNQSLSLSTLISLTSLPTLLRDSALIIEYIATYPSLKVNKHYSADLIAYFVVSSNDKSKLLTKVFQTKSMLLIQKVSEAVGLDYLDDYQYSVYFLEWLVNSSERKTPFRKLSLASLQSALAKNSTPKSKSRKTEPLSLILKYIKASKPFYLKDLITSYYTDENSAIRAEILPDPNDNTLDAFRDLIKNDSNIKVIICDLLDDSSDSVRLKCLKTFDWPTAVSFVSLNSSLRCFPKGLSSLTDRLLDKHPLVRQEMFILFSEGFTMLSSVSLVFCNSQTPKAEGSPLMKECILNILKGTLTAAKESYITALKRHPPSLTFLYNHRESPGVMQYISSMTISFIDMVELPGDVVDFYSKTATLKDISPKNVDLLLKKGIFSILKHATCPESHIETLFEAADSVENEESLEIIAENLKEHIRNNVHLSPTNENLPAINHSNDSKDTKSSLLPYHLALVERIVDVSKSPSSVLEKPAAFIFFLASHVQNFNPAPLLDTLFLNLPTYPILYFLSYKAPHDPRFVRSLEQDAHSNKKVGIILRTAHPETLYKYVDIIFKIKPSAEVLKRLLEVRTLVSALIYFCLTGRVSIQNPAFFIHAVRLLAYAPSIKRSKYLLKRYFSKISQEAANIFYTLAIFLQQYKVEENEDSLRNQMLYAVLKEAMAARKKCELVKFSYDVESLGFMKK